MSNPRLTAAQAVLPPKPPGGSGPGVATTDEEEVARLKADFRLFLIALWRFLLRVDPADIMLDMAVWLQHGPQRSISEAFRGFSKSWITGAYALWVIWNNPAEEQVLVVSGNSTKAKEAVQWCLTIILTWDLLKSLRPRPDQRSSTVAFDVNGAMPRQQPSFKATSITSQLAGNRATLIIPDDVETDQNSNTPLLRDSIKEAVKEFESIIIPEGRAEIKYLGTPHDEDSLYVELERRGYAPRIWPARYPDKKQTEAYRGKLAPYIRKLLDKLGPEAVGRSTMPSRFSDADLMKRERSIGRSTFLLQFMLDTAGADKDKYPLKMKDLIVASLDPRRGPENITWTNEEEHRLRDLPNFGFDGDWLHAGIVNAGTPTLPYTRIIAVCDPSGSGSDETGFMILAELNGYVFILKLYATREGFTPATLREISKLCVQYRVHQLVIEDNFGDGMFTSLISPVLTAAWKAVEKSLKPDEPHGTAVLGVKSTNQMAKEKRILAVLEPAVQQHRIVVDRGVFEWDLASVERMEGTDTRNRYSLGHQYSRLTRMKDALTHDDRVEVMALGVGQFADLLGVDPILVAKETSLEKQMEEFQRLYGPVDGVDDMGLPLRAKPSDRPKSFDRRTER